MNLGCAMAGRQTGCEFYLQPSPDQWDAVFMLALRYHLSGAISCCVLQNRANMNTMWHTINHMCPSGETQRIQILLCQQSCSHCLRGLGRQSSVITRTSWRLPVSRHPSDQCQTWTNVPGRKSKRWAAGFHLSSPLVTWLRPQLSTDRDSQNNSYLLFAFACDSNFLPF